MLTAFRQVEENLAQDQAVAFSQRYLALATDRYQLGLDPYLDVINAQTSLFSNQQTNANLRLQQLMASVQLIEALGGGWEPRNYRLPGISRAGNAQH